MGALQTEHMLGQPAVVLSMAHGPHDLRGVVGSGTLQVHITWSKARGGFLP